MSDCVFSTKKTAYLIFHIASLEGKGTFTICICKFYYAGDMMLTSFARTYSVNEARMDVSDSVISPA